MARELALGRVTQVLVTAAVVVLALALSWALVRSCGAGVARAANDPERRWFTLTTPHFAIHSHDDGEAFAKAVGEIAEEAWDKVGRLFAWHPKERIHVVVVDDYDAANGFASVLPYPAMTIWAHPPAPDSELGSYVNWLRLLVFHEYAHIVHLDHSGGIPAVFDALFGRVWKPNNALPRWVTEGIAVHIESSLTGHGRVGSALSEMHFRTAALAGRLPALSDLTGYPLQHPRGSMWYIHGGAIFDRIARERGDEAIARFAEVYGRHPIPYALNTLGREATGKTFVEWHEAVLGGIRERTERVRAARVERPGWLLRSARELLEAPAFTRDGRHLMWLETDGHDAVRIVRAPVPEPSLAAEGGAALVERPERILRCEGGCGRIRPSRDGRRLWMATGRHHKVAMFYSNLAELPLDGRQARRAPRVVAGTRRYYDPEPAADGRSVWAARTRWGVGELVRVDAMSGEELEVIRAPAPEGGRADWPRFDDPVASADGQRLWVSLHSGGRRDLYRVDLATRELVALTRDDAMEIDLALSPDERFLVYTSERDGIWDLYALELETGLHRRLTSTLTGAFQPTISPDGRMLVYRRWTLDGAELRALPFEPLAGEVVLGAGPVGGAGVGASTSAGAPVTGAERREAPPEPEATVAVEMHPYQALPTMLPRSWFPSLALSSSGLGSIALTFDAFDASGRHGLVLSTDYNLEREDWGAFGSYAWRGGFPDLTLQLGRYTWDRTSTVGDLVEPWREEVVYANASMSLPFPDVFAGLSWGMGFTGELVRGHTHGRLEQTPDQSMPAIPREGGSTAANVFFGVFDTRQHGLDISPSEGVAASFNVSLRDPAIGSRASALTFTFTSRAYLSLPGPRGHVLALRLGGGISGGDPRALSVFSLGGVPRQDILNDLLNQSAAGAVWLRGFPEGHLSGTRFGLLTSEWRFPLVRAREGLGTLPAFIEDLSLAVFSDVGAASWERGFPDLEDDLRVGLGVELRFRLELFFGLVNDFRLGYARGFGEHGIDQVYLLMAPAP